MSGHVPTEEVSSPGLVVTIWAVLAFASLVVAFIDAPKLGLYYDEAFMAQQARDFVDLERASNHPGSVRSLDVLGRPFPVRNAAYLGSLKSQLLIPVFAMAGASPRVLRVATFATAWIAVLFGLLVVDALFGRVVAIVAALLVASDPAFFFLGQYEWGPFTTNLLCRCMGAWFLLRASSSNGAPAWVFSIAAGISFGLGIFSRADFALVLVAAGLSILVFRRDLIVHALREKRGAVVAGSAALILAASPMIASLPDLLSTSQGIGDRGGFGERASVFLSTLDGTRFHRLMEVGGVFDRAFDTPASVTPTALFTSIVAAFALLVFESLRRRRDPDSSTSLGRRSWLLSTALLLSLLTIALPGAVRAHHQLNVLPLWHVVVAVTGFDLFIRQWRTPQHTMVARAGLSVAVCVLIASQLTSIAETRSLIADTGGRGRWSAALTDFATRVDDREVEVVSLDWGFHEQLLFLTRETRLKEAIWEIPALLRSGRGWTHAGNEDTVYLVHDERYDLFTLGPRLLALATRGADGLKGESDPQWSVVAHLDLEGEPAFYAIRIDRPHELVFDGRFRMH